MLSCEKNNIKGKLFFGRSSYIRHIFNLFISEKTTSTLSGKLIYYKTKSVLYNNKIVYNRIYVFFNGI